MTVGAQTLSHTDAALLPPVRLSVARGLHAPKHAAAPGPMLTLCLPAVASGHLYNAKTGSRANVPRPISRQSSRSLCVIQTPRQQGSSFKSHSFRDAPQTFAALRVCVPVVVNGSQDQRQRIAKVGVGGFHSSQSSTPRAAEASTR